MNRTITIIDSRRGLTAKVYQIVQFSDGSAGIYEPHGPSDKHPVCQTAAVAIDYVVEELHK